MKRTLLLAAVLASTMSQLGTAIGRQYNEGRETLGPDVSPYAKRPRKGKGERKANRANRWG